MAEFDELQTQLAELEKRRLADEQVGAGISPTGNLDVDFEELTNLANNLPGAPAPQVAAPIPTAAPSLAPAPVIAASPDEDFEELTRMSEAMEAPESDPVPSPSFRGIGGPEPKVKLKTLPELEEFVKLLMSEIGEGIQTTGPAAADFIRERLAGGGDLFPTAEEIGRAKAAGEDIPSAALIGRTAEELLIGPSEEELVRRELETGEASLAGAARRTIGELGADIAPISPKEIAFEAAIPGGSKVLGPAFRAGDTLIARGAKETFEGLAEGGLRRAALERAGVAAKRIERTKSAKFLSPLEKQEALGREVFGGVEDALASKRNIEALKMIEQEAVTLAPGGRKALESVKSASAKAQEAGDRLSFQVKNGTGIDTPRIDVDIPSPDAVAKKGTNFPSKPVGRAEAQELKSTVREALALPEDMRQKRLTGKAKASIQKLQAEVDNIRAQDTANSAKTGTFLGRAKEELRAWNIGISSGKEALRAMGEAGNVLGTRTMKALQLGEIRAGTSRILMTRVVRELSESQKRNLVQVLDKGVKAVDSQVSRAAIVIREIDKGIAKEAASVLKIRQGGRIIDWVPKKNFFPHILDAEATELALKDPAGLRDRLLKDFAEDVGMEIQDVDSLLRDKQLRKVFMEGIRAPRSKKNFSNRLRRLQKDISSPEIFRGDFIDRYVRKNRVRGSNQIERRAKATQEMSEMVRRHRDATFGNLEKGRTLDHEFWLRDPEKALNTYYDGAFKRLEMAKAWGREGQDWRSMVQTIANPSDRDKAESIMSFVAGTPRPISEQVTRSMFKTPVEIASTALMGLSTFSNAVQGLFGSSIKIGIRDATEATFKAWKDELLSKGTNEAREFAIASGALHDDIIRQTADLMGSREFLRKSGFSFTEEMNRITAAQAGKRWSARMMDNIDKGKDLVQIRKNLDSMGISFDRVAGRGSFTDLEVKIIANDFTNLTQGRARSIDLPLLAQSPEMRVMFQLKTFAFNWAKFLKDEVALQVTKKDKAKVVGRLIAYGAILGEPNANFRAFLSDRKRPSIATATGKELDEVFGVTIPLEKLTGAKTEAALARAIDNISWAGGIGMMSDIMGGLFGGARAIEGLFSPASVGLFGEFLGAVKGGILGPGEAQEARGATRLTQPLKFVLRRLVPLASKHLPTPLTLPAVVGARFAGERVGPPRKKEPKTFTMRVGKVAAPETIRSAASRR